MAALTGDKKQARREGRHYDDPVAGSTTIYKGALVALNATGYLVPMSVATGLIARGVAKEQVDNSGGADGDLNCKSETGIYKFVNDGTNPVSRATIGDNVYAEDDQTVSTNATGTSVAGELVDFDGTNAFVKVGTSA